MGKTYILDTNVLIDAPNAIALFRNEGENNVIIPYSVILELDRLKSRSDISHLVSMVSANLEADNNLEVIKVPEKRYHSRVDDNDIIEEIKWFKDKNPGREFIVATNDNLLRVRLKIIGVAGQEFKGSKILKSDSQQYTGIVSKDEERVSNCFYWNDTGKLIYSTDELEMNFEHSIWGVTPKNVFQNCAMHLMLDNRIDIMSIQSGAGYGKSYVSLAAALQLVLQKPKKYDKIVVIKPLIEIGEKMGYLPGSEHDKLSPYMKNIVDLIMKLHKIRPANGIFIDAKAKVLELDPYKIELSSVNFMRGRNIDNAVVILDEAQNWGRMECRTILSRMGENVKCFVLGDCSQIDSPHLNSINNGLNWIVKKFKGNKNYAHMVLKGAHSRGPICDMVLKTGL